MKLQKRKLSMMMMLAMLMLSMILVATPVVKADVATNSPGDDSGDWSHGDDAYSSNNQYAYISTDNKKHQFYDYDFSLGSATITKVEVGFEAYGGATTTPDKLCFRVRYDKSPETWSSWSSWYNLPTSDPNTQTWVDFTGATTWTTSKLSDTNFKVEVDYDKGSGGTPKAYLDWIPVRVTYSLPLQVEWVKSSGSTWTTEKDSFLTTEDVYAYIKSTGTGSKTVDIYVEKNRDWDDGDSLTGADKITKTTQTLTGSSTTYHGPYLVWSATLTAGDYDIIIDWNQNGKFDSGEKGDDTGHHEGFTVTAAPPSTVSITVTSSPATGSGFVKVDDTAYDTPKSFTWTIGSTHKLEALSPVAGPAGTRYVWTSWSDAGAQTHNIVTPGTPTTYTANYKTQYLATASYSTSDLSTPSSPVVLSGTQCGSPFTLPLTTSPQTAWLDAGTGWSTNNPIATPTEQWFAPSGTSGTITGPTTIAPFYYHQYIGASQMTVSYQVIGGGTIPPTFNYVQGGAPQALTLSATPTAVSFDASSTWSVTPNPLTGSSGTERWYSNQPLTGPSLPGSVFVFRFYHQYLATASYSTTPPDSVPTSPVVLSATQFGDNTFTLTLTKSAQTVWLDAGTPWSTNNPILDPSGLQRWDATSGTSGTITGPATIAPVYHRSHRRTQTVVISIPTSLPALSAPLSIGGSVTIEGVITDSQGRPLGNLELVLGWYPENGGRDAEIARFKTGPDGKFSYTWAISMASWAVKWVYQGPGYYWLYLRVLTDGQYGTTQLLVRIYVG